MAVSSPSSSRTLLLPGSVIELVRPVDAAQADGTTALHWAAHREDVELARDAGIPKL